MSMKTWFTSLLLALSFVMAPVVLAQKPDKAGNPHDKIAELQSHIADLEAQIAGMTPFDPSSLLEQFAALQDTVSDFNGQLDELGNSDTSLLRQLGTLQDTVGGFDGRISDLADADASTSEQLGALKGTVEGFDAQIAMLTNSNASALTQLAALQSSVDDNDSWLVELGNAAGELQLQIDDLANGVGTSKDITGATYQFTQIGGYVFSGSGLTQVSVSDKTFSYTFNADGTVSALYNGCFLINANIGAAASGSISTACPNAPANWEQGDGNRVIVSQDGDEWMFTVSGDGTVMVSEPQNKFLAGNKYLERHMQIGVRLSE